MEGSAKTVLLFLDSVKNANVDGELCFESERMIWTPSGMTTLQLQINYADIQGLKTSSHDSSRVKVKIILHNQGGHTFIFTNVMGRVAQLNDRGAAHSFLYEKIAEIKKDNALQENARMFSSNPILFRLSQRLVLGEILSLQEFLEIFGTKPKEIGKQEIGLPTTYLAEAHVEFEASEGLQQSLRPNTMERIFKTFPGVRKKYQKYVPDRILDRDFWSRFFQSHYLRLDKPDVTDEDFFSKCMEKDEQGLNKEQAINLKERIQNLSDVIKDENYLNAEELPIKACSLVKRSNHLSTMVLHSTDHPSKSFCERIEKERVNRRTDAYTGFNDDPKGRPLNLKKQTFMLGSMPFEIHAHDASDESAEEAIRTFVHHVSTWTPTTSLQLSFGSEAALQELSSSGSLVQDPPADDNLSETFGDVTLSSDLESLLEELRSLYRALVAMSIRFWSCFPTHTKERATEVEKMVKCLKIFKEYEIEKFEKKIRNYHFVLSATSLIELILEKIFTKHTIWKNNIMLNRPYLLST